MGVCEGLRLSERSREDLQTNPVSDDACATVAKYMTFFHELAKNLYSLFNVTICAKICIFNSAVGTLSRYEPVGPSNFLIAMFGGVMARL